MHHWHTKSNVKKVQTNSSDGVVKSSRNWLTFHHLILSLRSDQMLYLTEPFDLKVTVKFYVNIFIIEKTRRYYHRLSGIQLFSSSFFLPIFVISNLRSHVCLNHFRQSKRKIQPPKYTLTTVYLGVPKQAKKKKNMIKTKRKGETDRKIVWKAIIFLFFRIKSVKSIATNAHQWADNLKIYYELCICE